MRITDGRTRLSALWCLSLAVTACSDATGPLESLPRDLTPAESSVVSAANEFGLGLFLRLAAAAPTENVFFSPLSAYFALGMAANGAAGETLDEMRATLAQADLDEEMANEAYRGLLDLFLGLDDEVRFDIANSIWHRIELPVRPEFVETSRRTFDARIEALDFDDPGAPEEINRWVAERTNGRISKLVESLSPADVMLLLNAIYFKGTWQHEFDPDRTRDDTFTRPDGTYADVRMMVRERVQLLRHQRAARFEGIELLYGRGAYVMTILLPDEGVLPADLVAGIDAGVWQDWMEGFVETDEIEEVEMPRFRLEWEKSLVEELRAMGTNHAFGDADLSRLAEGGGGLFISDVRQKAFVEVNEEGTEAAAVTSVNVADSGVPTFRADRPFLFAIRERFSGTLLFIGQLLDPPAE